MRKISGKNFVPRVNLDGDIGTKNKKWNKVYANTLVGNADTAIKATQDKNGKDITTYLNKDEIITLNKNSTNISGAGTILKILNDYCTKLSQIQGNETYSENPSTNLKSLLSILNTKAPINNPSLTGSPTSITPSTEDNSTKIATTAFVNNLINLLKENGGLGGSGDGIVAASLTQNGWVKFNNGLILQWGIFSNIPNLSYVNLPISCNYTYCVIANDDTDHGDILVFGTTSYRSSKFKISGERNNGNITNLWGRYIAICC